MPRYTPRATGWWRINFGNRSRNLSIEGDAVGVTERVLGTMVEFIRENAAMVDEVKIQIRDGVECADSTLIDLAEIGAELAIVGLKRFLGAWITK